MKSYLNYLKQFENNVKPIVCSMFSDEGKSISSLLSDETKTNYVGKCLRPSILHFLNDGRAVEVGTDSRGNWIYAIFPKINDALNFKKPMSENVFFEQF